MKPIIWKLKSVRGRIIGYRASFAGVTGDGATKALATDACYKNAVGALNRLDRGTVVRKWGGTMYVVWPDLHGWNYTFDGLSGSVTCGSGIVTQEDAEDIALYHLGQYHWTSAVADDTAYVAGLPERTKRNLLEYFHAVRGAAAKAV